MEESTSHEMVIYLSQRFSSSSSSLDLEIYVYFYAFFHDVHAERMIV